MRDSSLSFSSPDFLWLTDWTLLQHVHPTDHTISYLGLLVAAHDAGRLTPEDLLTKITTFACTFDSRQIRYFGKHFSAVLGWISSGTLFPVSPSATAW
jgi:hypothetical protein